MPGFTNCKETPVNRSFPVRCLAALVALVGIRSAPAAPVTWTIDQPNSSWTWSGSLKDGSSTLASLSSQGTGSLTTTHTGTIVTTTTYVGGAPTQIQVTGGSIAAANSGNWQPLAGGGSGSAPGLLAPPLARPRTPRALRVVAFPRGPRAAALPQWPWRKSEPHGAAGRRGRLEPPVLLPSAGSLRLKPVAGPA